MCRSPSATCERAIAPPAPQATGANPVRRAIASMLTEDGWPIAPSTVRAFRTRPVSTRQCRDEDPVEHIARVHKDNYGVFGARTVWLTLEPGRHRRGRCTASG
jgi:hypothetical protein